MRISDWSSDVCSSDLDVAWEAHYGTGEATEWIIAFHEDVRMDDVRRAVAYGVGALAGAELDMERNLASSAPFPEGEDTWAADADLHELVGEAAAATYVERACRPEEHTSELPSLMRI